MAVKSLTKPSQREGCFIVMQIKSNYITSLCVFPFYKLTSDYPLEGLVRLQIVTYA